MCRYPIVLAALLIIAPLGARAQYMGNWTANPTLPPAPPQMPGTFNNQFGTTGNSPALYDSQGQFRGNLNGNRFDPNSVSNPFGRYGSQFSPESVNNRFGRYGSQFGTESPNNQFGRGLSVYQPGTAPPPSDDDGD